MLKFRLPFKLDYMLISIVLIGAMVRFYGISRESLWVDELITMNEVNPDISWKKVFEFISIADPHPPLFFILEKIVCSIFGHTAGVARGMNATLGTLSILFIYFLGKEILNKRLGYLAAILLCINYYGIFYSQEARDYALALSMSILSTLFFIKLLKRPSLIHSVLYGIFALLLLYTHYFGLFIIGGQGILALTLMLSKNGLQKVVFKYFYITAGIILIGYSPWLPSFIKQLTVTSFWIPPIPENFATSYFFEYFGNAIILEPILILLLLFYCWQVYSHYQSAEEKTIIDDPLHLSFAMVFFSIFFTLYVPYLRSVWVVPMLLGRYTIVLLPVFIIAIAYGIELIKGDHIRMYMIITVVILSFTHLIFNKRYYSPATITKTQFREVTEFMKDVGGAYPLIESGSTIWPHGFYLDKMSYHLPKFWSLDKIDSVLYSPYRRYNVDGFWLVGASPDERHPSPEVQRALDSAFTLTQSKTFFQAWAQLYVRKTGSWNTIFMSPFDFTSKVLRQSFDAVALLENSLESTPRFFKSGKYRIRIEQSGTKVQEQTPMVSAYIESEKIGEFLCSEYPYYGEKELIFNVKSDTTLRLKLSLDNEMVNADEKRLAYIRFIRIIPMNE
jgi:mannosyltransferase